MIVLQNNVTGVSVQGCFNPSECIGFIEYSGSEKHYNHTYWYGFREKNIRISYQTRIT